MAEYFDIDSDDGAEIERDPVMILSTVPTSLFGGGVDLVVADGFDDSLGFDEDTADTDPLGGVNPYADV
jgi:hypothetical protein